jgi:tetratricopeptide (TPR) repeat protein
MMPGQTPHPCRAVALNAAGNLARDQYDLDAARRHFGEARGLYTAAGEPLRVATIDNNLGNLELAGGDHLAAERLYRSSLAVVRVHRDDYLAALWANNLALALRRRAAHDNEVIELLEESITGFRRIGDTRGAARATESMARVLDARGRPAEALPLHLDALQLRIEAGDVFGRIYSIEGLARSLSGLGAIVPAARLVGHAGLLREQAGDPRKVDDEVEVAPTIAAVRAAIGGAALAHELERGTVMELEEIVRTGMEVVEADRARPVL